MFDATKIDEMMCSGFWPEEREDGQILMVTPLNNLLINPDYFSRFELKHGEIRGEESRNILIVF